MKRIVFTGGGSAGHVAPNLALIKTLQKAGWDIAYIGSRNGIEQRLVTEQDIPFFSVASGKLRRYFSGQNLMDPFKILFGIIQAYFLCRKLGPAVVFSKGGFVAFPVVVGAWLNRIPVVAHESDLTPGLANRLCFPFAKTICLTFDETQQFFPGSKKTVVTGTPIRVALFKGDAEKGRRFCGFSAEKKVLMVIGGGLGATPINDTVRAALPELLKQYDVVHLCGKGKTDAQLDELAGYKQFDYLGDELPDIFALADIILSRAGANVLWELIALRKLHLLVPLSKAASRGDQITNARYFQKKGVSLVLDEAELSPQALLDQLRWLEQHKATFCKALAAYAVPDACQRIEQQIAAAST